MDQPKRRELPFFPIALGLAAAFLGLLLLILARVDNPDQQREYLWGLVAAFVAGLGLWSFVSVQWRRRNRDYRPGRFSDGAAGRVATETIFTGSPWADTSTYRRPRRIKLDRGERKVWAEAARLTGLEFDRSRNPRLVGTLRGIEVRVDPVGGAAQETRARAALPISLNGQVTATPDHEGSIRIEGASPDLELALRASPLPQWLTAVAHATLEIENQGARALAPDLGANPDELRGLIEIAVSAAEAVTAWSSRK